MKAKLVKYPYDKKKYRWDDWYQGKEFQYFWDESLPNNFNTIQPYIKTEPINFRTNKYGLLLNEPFSKLSFRSDALYNYGRDNKYLTEIKYYPSFEENNEITRWAIGYKLPNNKTKDGLMEGVYYVIRYDNNRTFNIYFFKTREDAIAKGFTDIGYIADTTGVNWANYGKLFQFSTDYYETPDISFETYNGKYYPTIYLTTGESNIQYSKYKYWYKATYCPEIPHRCYEYQHLKNGINTSPYLGRYVIKDYSSINLLSLAGLIGFYSLANIDTDLYGSHPDYAYFRDYMLNAVGKSSNGFYISNGENETPDNENSIKLKIVYDECGLGLFNGAIEDRYDFSWNSANIPGLKPEGSNNNWYPNGWFAWSRETSWIHRDDDIKYYISSSVDLFKRYELNQSSKTEGILKEINVNGLITEEERNYLLDKRLSVNYVINYLHYKGKFYNPEYYTYIRKFFHGQTGYVYYKNGMPYVGDQWDVEYTNSKITLYKKGRVKLENDYNAFGGKGNGVFDEEDFAELAERWYYYPNPETYHIEAIVKTDFGDALYKDNTAQISKSYANKKVQMAGGYGIAIVNENEANGITCRVQICDFTPAASQVKALFNIESMVSNTSYTYNDFCLYTVDDNYVSRPVDWDTLYALTNEVYFIGDQTNDYITIPEGNTDILQYTLGEGINRQFVPKTLQLNAPCEYKEVEHIVKDGIGVNEDIDLTLSYLQPNGYYNLYMTDGRALYKDGDLYIRTIDLPTPLQITPAPEEVYGVEFYNESGTAYSSADCYKFVGNTTYVVEDSFYEIIVYILLQRDYNAFKDITHSYTTTEVASRTWLTFNSYSAQQWDNGFHFQGRFWNNLGSPFAYLNGITEENGNRRMVYTYDVAPAGNYVNAFKTVGDGVAMDAYIIPAESYTIYYSHRRFQHPINDFYVKDNLGNSYIKASEELRDYKHYWTDNVGSLWYFGTGEVSSTDRHAYPDEGSQNYHTYRLRPEDTTFLRYYRVRDQYYDIELFSDRYHYTHDTVDFCDRSYEGTVCGEPDDTGEDNIPDGTWREYMGLYLGESIPFLNITETVIPPAEILGVPAYDKQVNTSDTIKYGTVASASLSFVLNKPVGECMNLNNQLLVLYYDFKNRSNWERIGFFRVDTIEAIDEYTTSLVAHDETYKLNKYVDDFLEGYTQTTTLDLFYRDLLNYCDCFYDTHQAIIHNGNISMSNVYHAVKTTGIQVAHYVAILVPGFIHTDIDGDIVMSQYQLKDDTLTKKDYINLVYNAYNTDKLNKIKITSNNAVKGESTGSGENTYYLADDPLLSELQATGYFNDLANGILSYYDDIPTYRPATVNLLTLPRGLKVGDIVNLKTPKNEEYNVIVMRMSITSSGLEIQSYGTQKYPVEAESNSEFVNLINDMGEISGDVSNMMEAQETMATAIANNRRDIDTNTLDISNIITKNTQQDNSISALQTLTNGFGVNVSNNLASIILNGTTNNITTKSYVDNAISTGDTNTLNSSKSYTDSKMVSAFTLKTGTLTFSRENYSSATTYTVNVFYMGNASMNYGLIIPIEVKTSDYNQYMLYQVVNGSYKALAGYGVLQVSHLNWNDIYNVILNVS